MSVTQHTPGPWIIEIGDDRVLVSSASVENQGNPANGQNWICSVWIPKTGKEYSKYGHRARTAKDAFRAEANAKLIATAPELLAALEQVLMLDPTDDNEAEADYLEAKAAAVAAVNKARGF